MLQPWMGQSFRDNSKAGFVCERSYEDWSNVLSPTASEFL